MGALSTDNNASYIFIAYIVPADLPGNVFDEDNEDFFDNGE